jgi:hypothetical protein
MSSPFETEIRRASQLRAPRPARDAPPEALSIDSPAAARCDLTGPEAGRKIACNALKSLISRKENDVGELAFRRLLQGLTARKAHFRPPTYDA